MTAFTTCRRTLLIWLGITVSVTQFCHSQGLGAGPPCKDPTKWLPDPSSGLMWAEHDYVRPYHIKWTGLKWQEASDYCSALKIDGLSGWRLPTVDEVKGLEYTRHGVVTTTATGHSCHRNPTGICYDVETSEPHDVLTLKIDIGSEDWSGSIWTSTPSPTDGKSAWVVTPPLLTFEPVLRTKTNANHWSSITALCVRPMDAEILQVAKDAKVGEPVPDLQTLKANVPLTKARLAYQAGQYQESITQAQNALSIEPGLQRAYWGMGISYGMLGQWDLAIANLNSSVKLGKNDEVKAASQWAKASQKAAKKGEKPKIKGKEWKSPEWKGPPWS
ncbi:MAG: DUF1566 domain-containing protein [Candidatus Sulfotelmatobacter sp.]